MFFFYFSGKRKSTDASDHYSFWPELQEAQLPQSQLRMYAQLTRCKNDSAWDQYVEDNRISGF